MNEIRIVRQRLRQARLAAKMTQQQLAERIDRTQSHVSGYETGERTPTLEVTTRLAAALGVTVHWLCGEDRVHAELPADMRPEVLLQDPDTPPGLVALAADARLIESLGIAGADWTMLRSLRCPASLSKEGYLAVLLVVRGHT
jgi:transcriptional regulator with XRE-family HTH domain